MITYECLTCGGHLNLSDDKTEGICENCGNTWVVPKMDDDKRIAIFNRGNHFRRLGEFDKAIEIYEQIINEDYTDAEAHWCLALSRFGIDYVKDPGSGQYIPTFHRASYDIFLDDVDYQAALQYADVVAKEQYDNAGKQIVEVQKKLIAVSRKEAPYDIFISYKETDENGDRTKDSVLAQDIYYQLTDKGYKVFFSRISLEEIMGQEYEPYIFAALNSAKIMITIGTKPEYYNAVWVKNEWSRFLTLMKKNKDKLILPCYRDMSPYDMPEELSILQSYDMSQIGFVQDLLRGIEKIIPKEKEANIQKKESPGMDSHRENKKSKKERDKENEEALIERAESWMKLKEYEKAAEVFEQYAEIKPQSYVGWYGMLRAQLEEFTYDLAEEDFDDDFILDVMRNIERAGLCDDCDKAALDNKTKEYFMDYYKGEQEWFLSDYDKDIINAEQELGKLKPLLERQKKELEQLYTQKISVNYFDISSIFFGGIGLVVLIIEILIGKFLCGVTANIPVIGPVIGIIFFIITVGLAIFIIWFLASFLYFEPKNLAEKEAEKEKNQLGEDIVSNEDRMKELKMDIQIYRQEREEIEKEYKFKILKIKSDGVLAHQDFIIEDLQSYDDEDEEYED